MNILLADDHDVVRQGLKQILLPQYPSAGFGEARTSQQALDLVRRQRWDLLILDINMPGRSGLEALKDIKQAQPALPVLVLSIHPEDQYAIRVLKAGADGYLTKESASAELIQAVVQVLSGGKYVTASLAQRLASALNRTGERPPHEALSDREFQILCALAGGKTVTLIGKELSLSVKTVSTYRRRLLQKMRLETNADLTRYALQHGLV